MAKDLTRGNAGVTEQARVDAAAAEAQRQSQSVANTNQLKDIISANREQRETNQETPVSAAPKQPASVTQTTKEAATEQRAATPIAETPQATTMQTEQPTETTEVATETSIRQAPAQETTGMNMMAEETQEVQENTNELNGPYAYPMVSRESAPDEDQVEANKQSLAHPERGEGLVSRVKNIVNSRRAPSFTPSSTPGVGWKVRVNDNVADALTTDRFGRGESKRVRNQEKDEIRDKRSVKGNAILGKLVGSAYVNPNEVSIGDAYISAMLRQPGNKFLQFVRGATGVEIDQNSPTLVQDIIDAVNSNEIYVLAIKEPTSRTSSEQARVLRVHTGRGIYLHPTQFKVYNADADGDEMLVSFDQRRINQAQRAMTYLIDINGQPTLDMDFWPITYNVSEADLIDLVENVWLDWLPDTRVIGEALYQVTLDPSNDNVISLINAIREVAQLNSTDEFGTISDIIRSIYDGSRDFQRLCISELAINASDEVISYDKIREPADMGIQYILDDMQSGHPAPNFQDFKIVMSKYIGEVITEPGKPNKNAAFRIGAEVAKMIGFDPRIEISDANMSELYERTMAFGTSLQLSNRASIDNKLDSMKQYAQNVIKAKVGTPNVKPDGTPWESFGAFMQQFVYEYSKIERIIDAANVQFRTNLSYSGAAKEQGRIPSLRGKNIDELTNPFLSIYPDYTVGYLFKNFIQEKNWVTNPSRGRYMWGKDTLFMYKKYKDMPLEVFARQNKILIPEKNRADLRDFDKMSDMDLAQAMIYGIADKKTSQASAYSTSLDSLLDDQMKAIFDLSHIIEDSETVRDWNKWVEDITSMLYASGSRLFNFFGMDSPYKFMKSEWGKAMTSARDADHLGGIRLSMMVEMRLDKLGRIQEEIDRKMAAAKTEVELDQVSIADEVFAFNAELESLASSSMAWSAIVKEMKTDGEAWNYLKENNGFATFLSSTRTTEANSYEFWKNISTHEGIVEYLLDPEIARKEKETVLSDIVRYHELYIALNSYEMTFQLEQDSDPSYTTNGIVKLSASSSDMFSTAISAHNNWARRGYDAAVQNIVEARTYCEKEGNIGLLDDLLKDFANNQWKYCQIHNETYADALTVVLDREFHQAEKSKQHALMNNLYASLMTQREGRYTHDLWRADDRALGIISKKQLTGLDLIRLLADPDLELRVYDEFGNMDTINCEKLCGGTDVNSKWDYLLTHPRAAMALRQHHMVTTNDDAYLAAMGTTSAAMRQLGIGDTDGKLKYILRDHPRYGGMIALMTPTWRRNSRTLRNEYIQNEQKLIGALQYFANNGIAGAQAIDMLGLTEDAILAKGCSQEICSMLRADIAEAIDRYTDEIKDDIVATEAGKPDPFNFDISSIAAYFDIKQELSGAKTEISTGIEGSETHQMFAWITILNPVDTFDEVGSWTEEEVLDQLQGCMTNTGFEIGSKPIEELEQLANGELIVHLPEGWVVGDKTLASYVNESNVLTSDGIAVSSISAYLMIKRDDGAEKFNLKIKKFGDDGRDSITKQPDYASGIYDEIYTRCEEANADYGIDAAKVELARILMEVNETMGYTEAETGMKLRDYVNIADMMIVEDETGMIAIRSLEQIALAVRNGLPFDLVKNGNMNQIRGAAKEIAAGVGSGIIADTSSIFDGINISGSADFKPGLRGRSSSLERNFALMQTVAERAYNGNIPGAKTIGAHEHELMKMFNDDKIENLMPSTTEAYMFRTVVNNLINKQGFHYLGCVGNSTFEAPGTRNFWIVPSGLDEKLVQSAVAVAQQKGITLVYMMDSYPSIFELYTNDAIPTPGLSLVFPHGDNSKDGEMPLMLPFFDMELNGSYAQGFTAAPASYQLPHDQIVFTAEDSENVYGITDAQMLMFKAWRDQININYNEPFEFSAWDLFYETMQTYNNVHDPGSVDFSITPATWLDVERWIINQAEGLPTIDLGISVYNKNRDELYEKMLTRIDEYRQAVNTDNNGWLRQQIEADRIVGWLKCKVSRDGEEDVYTFAPVIPFRTEANTAWSGPDTYSLDAYSWNAATQSVKGTAKWDGDLTGAYAKGFEGQSPSNKFMVSFDAEDGGSFRDGTPLHGVYLKNSTASRRVGTAKRLASLNTLYYVARGPRWGYNFATLPDAFPENPELKEELATTRIESSRWQSYMDQNIRFHKDDEIDAFVRSQIKWCLKFGTVNPSDFLATYFGDKSYNVYWEFDAFHTDKESYQNGLLKFFNAMMPELCPDNMYSNDETKLFRVCQDKGDDLNCLQMQIPYRQDDGTYSYKWGSVYAGLTFFGKDFSGFSRPNINGANSYFDAVVAAAVSGKDVGKQDMRSILMSALSDRTDPKALYNRPSVSEFIGFIGDKSEEKENNG